MFPLLSAGGPVVLEEGTFFSRESQLGKDLWQDLTSKFVALSDGNKLIAESETIRVEIARHHVNTPSYLLSSSGHSFSIIIDSSTRKSEVAVFPDGKIYIRDRMGGFSEDPTWEEPGQGAGMHQLKEVCSYVTNSLLNMEFRKSEGAAVAAHVFSLHSASLPKS